MSKITEKKLSKLISQGSLFWNGMLLTSDEIYEKVQGYSYNTNLNLKTNREKVHIKKLC
jgi:hypothetical protein